MNHVQQNGLLSFVVLATSFLLSSLFFIPFIGVELKGYQYIFGLIIWSFIYFTLGLLLEKKINQYINNKIDNDYLRKRYINEFFDFMENDNQFRQNVLKKDIPIIDNGKEIGIETIYSAFRTMFYKRFGSY